MNKTVAALLWGVLGTLLFTVGYASGKLTGGETPVFQIVFIRFASGFATLLLVASLKMKSVKDYSSRYVHFHLMRSFCGSLGVVCVIYASQISSIADVTALSLTDGLLTVILSILILGEVVNKMQWFGALLCAAGALVVILGSSTGKLFGSFNTGLWLALLAALLIAIESILIKVLAMREKPVVILLYVNFFSMLVLLFPAIYVWETPGIDQFVFFILLGPIAITAQYCWIVAYSLENVSVVTPINYTWIVFAAILGYLFFDEPIGGYLIVGAVLITAGGIILARPSALVTTKT